jgi:hypothetical protein
MNLGPASYGGPNPGTFRPYGKLVEISVESLSGIAWQQVGKTIRSARIIVGLAVGHRRTWQPKHVIEIVKEVRLRQIDDPAASFLVQQGIYQYQKGTIVEEESVQVAIIDTVGIPAKVFEAQMIELAEALASRLRQETVIVDIQANGVTKKVLGVTA